MKNQDMRYMSRQELVDIILEQKHRETELQDQLTAARRKLNDRDIHISSAGSIAEAALELNGIFEVAQRAADQYLDSVKSLSEDVSRKIEDAQAESERIIADAHAEAERVRIERLTQTEKEIMEKWTQFENHIQSVLRIPPDILTYFKPRSDE